MRYSDILRKKESVWNNVYSMYATAYIKLEKRYTDIFSYLYIYLYMHKILLEEYMGNRAHIAQGEVVTERKILHTLVNLLKSTPYEWGTST